MLLSRKLIAVEDKLKELEAEGGLADEVERLKKLDEERQEALGKLAEEKRLLEEQQRADAESISRLKQNLAQEVQAKEELSRSLRVIERAVKGELFFCFLRLHLAAFVY